MNEIDTNQNSNTILISKLKEQKAIAAFQFLFGLAIFVFIGLLVRIFLTAEVYISPDTGETVYVVDLYNGTTGIYFFTAIALTSIGFIL